MSSLLISLVALASLFVLWAVVKRLLASGALNVDKDIRRLGSYDWFTRDPRERHYMRRDAAEILSRSENPVARRYAVKCLRRKPNLGVLDECLDEIIAGVTHSDPRTAQGCADLLYACLAHGVQISLRGHVSGVAMTHSGAERYLEMIRQAPRTDIVHATIANKLVETEELLNSYLRKPH